MTATPSTPALDRDAAFCALAVRSVATYGPTMLEFTAADGYVDKMMIPDLAPPGVYNNSELWHNTAHATAKLLLKALHIVVLSTGHGRLPFWGNDIDEATEDLLERGEKPDYLGVIADLDHCAFQDEFRPGAEDTEALCDALVARGSKEIEA